MYIELDFDFYSAVVFLPDGMLGKMDDLQESFLEWVSDQPDCLIELPGHILGLRYNEEDFIKYVNEELLKDYNERAYLVQRQKCIKIHRKLKF